MSDQPVQPFFSARRSSIVARFLAWAFFLACGLTFDSGTVTTPGVRGHAHRA
ncbi:hypothetical protein JCM18916_2254 [Cutibacterium acnes JCM 18916]|nr:hypothetical protein JCM18916_2254 [Cutibacterium acnes JCM 18916]